MLVLKRFPTGIDTITDALVDAIEGVETLRVRGLSAHARETLEELPSPPRLLSTSQQGSLLTQSLSAFECDHPYLEQAAQQDSFESDVGRFIAEATWQGSVIDTDEAALVELDAFHDWLADSDLLNPSAVLSWAADVLAEPEHRDQFSARSTPYFVLKSEDFTPSDREYLTRLTTGIDLVCLAERNSTIQLTWNEPRRIEAYCEGLRTEAARQEGVSGEESDLPSDVVSKPAAVAGLLAKGKCPPVADHRALTVVHELTFDAHIRMVAVSALVTVLCVT